MNYSVDRLDDQYCSLPTKQVTSFFFVCKAHYINWILEELAFDSKSRIPTYTHTSLSKEEILQNHVSVLNIF
jgi:hypothetical protein